MAEWLKARAWKVRIPHKGIGGSNPFFSAMGSNPIQHIIVSRHPNRYNSTQPQLGLFIYHPEVTFHPRNKKQTTN